MRLRLECFLKLLFLTKLPPKSEAFRVLFGILKLTDWEIQLITKKKFWGKGAT